MFYFKKYMKLNFNEILSQILKNKNKKTVQTFEYKKSISNVV